MMAEGLDIRIDERLPRAGSLRNWLSSAYVQQTNPDEHLARVPFEHFVLPELLRSEVFSILAETCLEECQRPPLTKDHDERGLRYAPLLLRPAIDFFCGTIFRRFLGSVVCGRVARPSDSVPQLRRLIGPAPGMRPHSDSGVSFSFATFFFVHRSWNDGQGGETVLFDSDVREFKRIPPRANTLYGMFFSSKSLHAVSQLADNADRILIYQEWMRFPE
jgi:2OG-Fe(II) oxygenase superfamily